MRLSGLLASALLLVLSQEPASDRIDFVREIQPILRDACFKCHGPEKQKGQLRLDAKAAALKGGLTGPAIVPGKSAESLLVKLLLETDAELRMPQKAPAFTKATVDLFRRWIDEGADWPESASAVVRTQKHWAYVKPVRPTPPRDGHPIDAFVRARLEKEGLAPSPEAPKETLIRRVSLDLVGLPPSPEEVDAFLADAAPGAWERLVDRLLASPHYGERWARPWLDLARYADTNGFNFDSPRTMWRWRDWVIDALNRDLPFTRFTIEQIAGDLLPNATLDQRIAAGFHRNTMLNEEGGVDREEARWETFLDRVNTTATVWLGTTMACAQCHNHKYDPFSQKDFYRLLAFFDHQKEETLELLSPEQEARRSELKPELARLKAFVKAKEKDDTVEVRDAKERVARLTRELKEVEGNTALSFREKPTPPVPSTRVRIRGSYDVPGEIVSCGVPEALHPLPDGASKDRLGLARWLVSEENPLVARVTVNRAWDAFFGRPLVETPEDFGTQGALPAQPELLDWLATEFVRLGWSPKALHRTIVTSATYRQSSRATPALVERDPYNRLLARGPRFRLEAEMIRDQMLAAAGLLSRKIGGPSVYPLQADTSGVVAINKVDTSWTPSPGEDRHRRGLYTYWRRTAPFVMYGAFDAPSRECCIVKRARTNTPLQALVGLNDPAHWDAARGLAGRILAEAGPTRDRIVRAFRLCTARRPDAEELSRIEAALERERREGATELAAWTLVANVLLNLDETLTKE
jgi:hypothetical protein